MKVFSLIKRAKLHLASSPPAVTPSYFPLLFTGGAHWMTQQLNTLDGRQRRFDPSLPYELYGYGKYAFCLLFSVLSMVCFWQHAIFLIPLFILVFYFIEVHLLFLFPLLINQVDTPVKTSIRMAHRIGIWTAISNIMVLGGYMLVGLLNYRAPLRNWYVGCTAVLIWYNTIVE